MTILSKTIFALTVALLLAPLARAQDGDAKPAPADAARLDALLAELRAFSPEAWEQRLAAMRKSAEQQVADAKRMRAEAKRLEDEAAKREAAAKAVEAEIQQLSRLRELLGSMKFRAPAPQPGEPKPAEEMAKPAPEKPAAEKPAAAKPAGQDAKVMPKEGEAKAEAEAAGQPIAMAAAAGPQLADEDFVTYDDHLLLIFEDNCTVCHEAGDASGGLDLSTYAAAIQGGGSGRTIKPFDPMGSRLHALVSHREKPTMPPDEPRLEKEILDTIATWIEQGAPENLAHARKLAVERAKQRAAAEAARAAAVTEPAERPAILPEGWSVVDLVVRERPPALRAVACSPVAPVLAIPGHDQVVVMHAENRAILGVVDFPFGQIESLAFSADGARLVAAGGIPGQQGGVVVYDVRTGAAEGRFGEAKDSVFAAAIAASGDRLALGGTRERVDVVDPATGRVLFRVEHDDWVQSLDLSADGKLLASSDRSGLIRVTELRTGRAVHELRGHEGSVTCLRFDPSASTLATAGVDQRVRGWRMADGREVWNERRHGGEVLGLTWLDAEHLISTDSKGVAVFWKRNSRLDVERVAQDWVYAVAAAPGASQAVAVDFAGGVTFLDAKTRKVVERLEPFAIDPAD